MKLVSFFLHCFRGTHLFLLVGAYTARYKDLNEARLVFDETELIAFVLFFYVAVFRCSPTFFGMLFHFEQQ